VTRRLSENRAAKAAEDAFQFYGKLHLSLLGHIGLGMQFWHPTGPRGGTPNELHSSQGFSPTKEKAKTAKVRFTSPYSGLRTANKVSILANQFSPQK
jgi:hypothetical protein